MPQQDAYDDIRDILNSSDGIAERYAQLYNLLLRLCTEYSTNLGSDFSGLFSRLYAVCKAKGIDYHGPDRFRRRARLAMRGAVGPLTEDALHADVALLVDFVAQLSGCPLPVDLTQWQPSVPHATRHCATHQECLRAVVTTVGTSCFTCLCSWGDVDVDARRLGCTFRLLRAGQRVNLIDFSFTSPGRGVARLIIIEPDYLIDVSALTAAVKPYGSSADNYLLDLLSPHRMTSAILLGEAANLFLDTAVHAGTDQLSPEAEEQLYAHALHQHFIDNLLPYVGLEETLDKNYFALLRRTFHNICRSVASTFPSPEVGMPLDEVLLEPSFICEVLGLRGRLDAMTTDHGSIVELKSGRAEEYDNRTKPRLPHVLQMSLYKEILHYNLGLSRDSVRTFLFYSRYPVFFDERTSAQAVADIMELRNSIVVLEAELREGHCREILARLTPDLLNRKGLSGRFWCNYLRPTIESVTTALGQMEDIQEAYFCAFLTFVEREKFLAKTSDNRPDSGRGLASTWTVDFATKFKAGDILADMRLVSTGGNNGVETLEFALPDYGNDFVPNFSVGEMVQLYERNGDEDRVTTRQLFRGYIEVLTADLLRVHLAYKQRGAGRQFPISSRYAVEHDGSDASSRLALRGLFSLLTAERGRCDLLLARREPKVDEAEGHLFGTYPEDTATIVRQAFAAQDYFLLMGPPGTGKTSVALRAMVEEFLLRQRDSSIKPGIQEGLLIMAYTNRAVDEVCGMLAAIGADYLRVGTEQTCPAVYRDKLLSVSMSGCCTRTEAVKRLQGVPVFVGTVMALSTRLELLSLRPFTAIIDEASQVLEPQLLGLLCARRKDGTNALRRFIMVGDHKQLPAVVALPPNQTVVTDPRLRNIGLIDLRNSLFHRLYSLQLQRGWKDVAAMLYRQGRMHADICRFAADEFYGGQLKLIPLPHQIAPLRLNGGDDPYSRLVAATRLGFVDVRQKVVPVMAKANMTEAMAVAQLVETIVRLYGEIGEAVDVARQVGVIVPFRNQIAQVRHAFRQKGVVGADALMVDTVECYQGSQRDFIIFCTVVSHPRQLALLTEVQQVDGIDVDRKLNVAVTRARRQFFLVGNGDVLSHSPVYSHLMAACRQLHDFL